MKGPPTTLSSNTLVRRILLLAQFRDPLELLQSSAAAKVSCSRSQHKRLFVKLDCFREADQGSHRPYSGSPTAVRSAFIRGSFRISANSGHVSCLPTLPGPTAVLRSMASMARIAQTCENHRMVEWGGTDRHYRCRLSDTDSRFRKYPRLPVETCAGYQRGEPATIKPGG
jgi:hypothetical protein